MKKVLSSRSDWKKTQMNRASILALSFLFATSAHAFGAKPPAETQPSASPIDFSSNSLSVSCVTHATEMATSDSAWRPTVDPTTGFSESQNTSQLSGNPIQITYGQTALVAIGLDGFDENSEVYVNFTHDPSGKPILVFFRTSRTPTCPGDFMITPSQFAFSGWDSVTTTTTPITLAYTAKVVRLTNSCGQSGQWMAGLGSSVSYEITCTVK